MKLMLSMLVALASVVSVASATQAGQGIDWLAASQSLHSRQLTELLHKLVRDQRQNADSMTFTYSAADSKTVEAVGEFNETHEISVFYAENESTKCQITLYSRVMATDFAAQGAVCKAK